MGEYAKRKADGTDIKIGTCKSMYYCRYDQRKEVEYPYNSDNFYWRIPTPDEDGTLPGDYDFSLLQKMVTFLASSNSIHSSLAKKILQE